MVSDFLVAINYKCKQTVNQRYFDGIFKILHFSQGKLKKSFIYLPPTRKILSIMTIFGRPVLLFLCSMLSLYCGHMYFSQSFPGRVFSLSSSMAAQAGNFPVFSAFSPLLSRQYCDISSDYSAWNGKIACLRSQEKAGHRLRACLGRVAWFARERPRRRGRRAPPLSGAKVRTEHVRMRVVPRKGCLSSPWVDEGLFSFPPLPAAGRSTTS